MMQFKKKEEITFFFSQVILSVEAQAWYEMTAIIKLAQSERQALLSPWKYTLIDTRAHSQAFTAADRVKAEHTELTRLTVVTGLDLLALEEESGISTWLQRSLMRFCWSPSSLQSFDSQHNPD